MKIVYLFKSLANKGGTERILTDKMNFLAEHLQHEIYVISCEQGKHPYAYPMSPKIHHKDLDCRFFTLKKYNLIQKFFQYILLILKYSRRLKKSISDIKPDIVICTTYSYQDIHTIARLPSDIVKIAESHVARFSIEFQYKLTKFPGGRLAGKLIDHIIYQDLTKFSALVALTKEDALSWQKLGNVKIIPNFVNYYPEKLNQKPGSKKIISVGRLDNKQKGYDLLIKAWSKIASLHAGWTIHVYGSGEDKASMLKDIQNNHLEDSFIIHEATSDIFEKYQESEFYVLSSRYEGFGLVLLEAMACGLPCISFNCPHGPAEIIHPGEDGFLVEAENIDELSQKISYLIENENIKMEMRKKARENVKKYQIDNIMPQWENLFTSLTDKKQLSLPKKSK